MSMATRVVQGCNKINTNLTRLHQLLDCCSDNSGVTNFKGALLGREIVLIRHVVPAILEVYQQSCMKHLTETLEAICQHSFT